MSDEQAAKRAKPNRCDVLEARFLASAQETAEDVAKWLQEYVWKCNKREVQFGATAFTLVYRKPLTYDIDPHTLDLLVQATHDALRDEYDGGPFDEYIIPSYAVFVGILDKLVAMYKITPE